MTQAVFWNEVREMNGLVVDAPSRKIAVYPNDGGMVVVAIEDGGGAVATTVQVCEIDVLVSLLLQAKMVAEPMDALIDAQYTAHCVIQKARGLE